MIDLVKGIFNLIKLDFGQFVLIFNSIPIEISWLFFLLFCFFCILFFLKLFGEVGLYIYTVIAIIAGNIQVLKIVKFSFFSEPIALGTILFASTFLCTDILAENYGIKQARKNVIIGFFGFLLMTLMMLFTLGFEPLDNKVYGEDYFWAIDMQESLMSVFLPFPTFFVASMIAYLASQYFDIWFFSLLSKLTNKKHLWLRNNFSTILSSLIDTSIFSFCAFIFFAVDPLDLYIVIMTYIIGSFFMRVFIALFDTPFIYFSRYFIKNIN